MPAMDCLFRVERGRRGGRELTCGSGFARVKKCGSGFARVKKSFYVNTKSVVSITQYQRMECVVDKTAI
jgi:DNA-binding LytR/AlgR family response regulator